ncbi:MAG TPA: DUF885 family protein [Thermoanaerobaculia bacterium]|nr:DUF885 family protein [Thermoanaerobaculia bacterium]
MKKIFFLLLMAVTVSTSMAAPVKSLQVRRKSLNALLDEYWQLTLRENPEFASILGDKRWNDRLSDLSLEQIETHFAGDKAYLKRFQAIDTTGFPEQEMLNKALMVRQLENEIEDHRFKSWEMPVSQIGGIHLDFPELVSSLDFSTLKDYEDFNTRLRQFPRAIDQTIGRLRSGMADKLMPPRFLLEKVATQAANIAAQKAEETPFAQPLNHLPAGISPDDQARVRSAILESISAAVLPSYRRFAAFVRDEYAPQGRRDVGMWALPDGADRYAVRVRRSTTTDLSPETIHQIGIREVARIESEMLQIAHKLGFQDLKTLNASIEKNPELHAQSREQILDLYRKYIGQMEKKLPQLFGRLPRAKLEVLPVEQFREKEAAGASYNQGTPDGSRPGHVMVNTSDPQSRKIISVESTSYHEGLPGHHLQIALAQELPALPPFRQQAHFTAYVEGWALYTERLGKDVGFYTNPYSDYGRLQDEMLRAIRLVVDTGLHAKKWTREQVVQYFHDHSAIDEVEVQSETDRYIVWPAQALGYKIGQMKILELRERARKELGSKFDIRQFHDHVLDAGALPMNMLEDRINKWIASKKKG